MGAGGISGSGKVIKSSLKESIGFESMLGEGKVFRERWFVRGKGCWVLRRRKVHLFTTLHSFSLHSNGLCLSRHGGSCLGGSQTCLCCVGPR